MWIKVGIVLVLLLIVYNLAAALFFMLRDESRTGRTARALSWRIGLSLALFALLIIGRATGFIEGNVNPITGRPEPGLFGQR